MSEIKTSLCQGIETPKQFCTCPITQCPRHPSNHNQGCDLCIKDNIEKRKMPACMFAVVSDQLDVVKDYTIKGFVDFYLNQEKIQNKKE